MKHNYGTIVINGKYFEIDYNACMDETYDSANIHPIYSSVWNAYVTPSRTKEAVWEEWCHWFRGAGADAEWAISSRNSMKFTITGKVMDAIDQETGAVYDMYFVITADHNRAWFLSK